MDFIPIPTNVNVKDIAESLPQTTQAIDKALASAVNIANICLTPIEIVKAHSDYALAKTKIILQEKLKNIPNEKIIPPAPYIAVPTLQAISYSCDCDELHSMFASLLATSMNSDTKKLAHPSFIEIIKQLSPEDAKVLNSSYAKNIDSIAMCSVRFQNPSAVHELKEPFFFSTEGRTILQNFSLIEDFVNISELSSTFENLFRLGLYDTNPTEYFTDPIMYESFKRLPPLETIFNFNDPSKPTWKLCLVPRAINITDIGKLFRAACIL